MSGAPSGPSRGNGQSGWRAQFGQRLLRYALPLAVGFLVGFGVFHGENAVERFFLDLRFLIASATAAQELRSDAIAILLMDRRSSRLLNTSLGTKLRAFHPSLIEKLNEAGASLIAFDALFDQEEPRLDPDLAESLREAGNVLAAETTDAKTTPLLRAAFAALGDPGASFLGGVPRYVRLHRAGSEALAPFAVVTAREYWRRTGGRKPPPWLDSEERFWINYRDGIAYFPTFSYADVVLSQSGRLSDKARTPLSIFGGKVVLIGLDDPSSTGDRFALPNSLGGKYPGVFGQAYALDTILEQRPVRRVPLWLDGLFTLAFLAALVGTLAIRWRAARVSLQALLPLAALAAVCALELSRDLWVGFAPVLVGGAAVLAVHWTASRIALAASFRKAVGFDPKLIEAFRAERARSAGPVSREVTILVADIRDYTRFVSTTDPAAVAEVMGECMVAMERCVTSRGGYINKFVGDEIIAVFGFPLSAEGGSSRAVAAAVAMLAELDRLKESWRERGRPGILRIGIGIDCGQAAFVEIGGTTKRQFDIIGDCINGAARLQDVTKQARTDLLISEAVWSSIQTEDSLAGSFACIGEVPVRGQGKRRLFKLLPRTPRP